MTNAPARERPGTVFDRSLSQMARKETIEHFIDFTEERDGLPDVAAQTLSKRPLSFVPGQLPLRPRVDRSSFERALSDESAFWESGPLIQFLASILRANQGESWGVQYHLAHLRSSGDARLSYARVLSDLQEVYHTRILADLLQLFDLAPPRTLPPWALRQSIKSVYRLPDSAANLLMLGGELVGTLAFRDAIDDARTCLNDFPELCDLVTAMLETILVDEIGHVTFLLSLLSRRQLRALRLVMRGAVGVIGRAYMREDHDAASRYLNDLSAYSLELFPPRLRNRAFVSKYLLVT